MRNNNIAILRKSAKLSQKELGEKLGIAQTTVSGWEIGRNEPDIAQLDKMSKIFNVTISYLMGYEDDKTSPAVLREINTGEKFNAFITDRMNTDEIAMKSDEQEEYAEKIQENEKEYALHVLHTDFLKSGLPIYFESYYINRAFDHMVKSERERLLDMLKLAFPIPFDKALEE